MQRIVLMDSSPLLAQTARIAELKAEVERLRASHDTALVRWASANRRLREAGDEVVRVAREVMHGREHSGALLLAMKSWEALLDG